MKIKYILLAFLLSYYINTLFSQVKNNRIKRKSIDAIRVEEKINVDGKFSENIWKKAPIATDFIQIDPDNAKPANFKTEVKILYDNTSLYIGAVLYDPNSEKINNNLSKRDNLENNDFFLIALDPFNNGLDGVEFIVTPSNVQLDAKVINDNEDFSWDAVWKSAAIITEKGWNVEIEIPYSALRIPNLTQQKWGFNIVRNIQRKGEKVSWNLIDKKISGYLNQSGELTGFKNLQPPLRLLFTPYTSVYLNKNTDNEWSTNFKGGMDMKLGIDKSHTLDMILIPDFDQVKSDDVVLNLSPFEIKFNENRQFFTEGMEIFSRGNIFYSRRIGSIPRKYYDVEDLLNKNEIIEENPIKNKILNATKLSGRDGKGLGIGFLNAITDKSIAKINDTITGKSRNIITQSFTNYNLLFFDKSLKNESYISFFNSNLLSPKDDYLSNVTGTEIYLKNKSKTYGYGVEAMLSHRQPGDEDNETGFKYELSFKNLKGAYRYGFYHNITSDNYNHNDLGFMAKNNFVIYQAWVNYNMPNPNEKYIRKSWFINLKNEYLFNPYSYSEIRLFGEVKYTLKSYKGFGVWSSIRPLKLVDYIEPRVEGRKYKIPPTFSIGSWFQTDYRKNLVVNFWYEIEKTLSSDNQLIYVLQIHPVFRFSNKLTVRYKTLVRYQRIFGYANNETIGDKEEVYFGRRKNLSYDNVLSVDYILNSKMYFELRARHYFSDVKYRQFYTLNDDGTLSESTYNKLHDQVYNAFNIQGNFTFRFAPGSDLSFVWKNILNESEEYSAPSYFSNFNKLLQSPKANSFSIRLIYYLDYNRLKKKF